MNSYSDILDKLDGQRPPDQKLVRLPFRVMDCDLNEVYEAKVIFRPTEIGINGSTVEIIDFKKINGEPNREAGPRIVPSPS